MSDTNTQHKDRLFKFIFGNPEHKEWTLSLYNALNGSDYTDPEAIEFNTIENVIYMGTKNDVSFIVMDAMSLWEHQSSVNPNLPVRFLIYAGQLYDKYLAENDIYRYGRRLHRLPKPECICFYNGTEDQPEEKFLRLSEAFGADDGDIEVRVRMLNINYGYSRALMEVCKVLEEYSQVVDGVRKNRRVMRTLGDAVDAVIDDMPDDYILKKFLVAHRAEVKGMYLTEYNAEKEHQRALREGHEEGREEGLAEGREIGLEEGREEGLAEGREIGLAEGQNAEQNRVAADMLRKNLPLTLIEEISRLPQDTIRSIAANLGITLA